MTIQRWTILPLLLTAALLLLFSAGSASGASLVAKDGKIHACYKAKGKGKGSLRVVRNGKVRCPKKWKKVAWYAAGQPGPAGPQGETGSPGATGGQGERGLTGAAGNVVVEGLEDKVTELLTKVQSLEAVLKGITNTDLKNAIALGPVVTSLCEQGEELTDQTTALGKTLGSLNTVLGPLLIGFSPVTVPTALPPFSCPNL